MLRELAVKHPDIEQDNPTPAFVLERPDEHFVVKPVVLGLTDGSVYEVLADLSFNELVVVGIQPG